MRKRVISEYHRSEISYTQNRNDCGEFREIVRNYINSQLEKDVRKISNYFEMSSFRDFISLKIFEIIQEFFPWETRQDILGDEVK